ncbi:hypothetical protein [Stenotrophomonas rhizophila]|uniref:hypothetical protein n=1 Tax=Stenotrophomonas rhizophila TaxID=216778 RepID=UPI0011C4A901|nr:hypothetical protein [Stenotrophomonas rhizophila]
MINATMRASSGCLITLGGQASTHASVASTAVASLQAATWAAVYRRLQLSLSEGALSATADLSALADFLITVVDGISLQAQRGTKAPALESAATMAVNALPWIEPGSQRPSMADTVD